MALAAAWCLVGSERGGVWVRGSVYILSCERHLVGRARRDLVVRVVFRWTGDGGGLGERVCKDTIRIGEEP